MAQVTMQTTPNHSGPTLSPAALPPIVTTASAGIQPSVNGSFPESAVGYNNSATVLVDSTPSSNSQGNELPDLFYTVLSY